MVRFDATHLAVHYPKDRRFRIWVHPSILVGIAAAVLCVVLAASTISRPVRTLLMEPDMLPRLRTGS
jgi:hypothetical protein